MKLMRSLAPLAAVVFLTAGMCDDEGDDDQDPTIAGVYTVSEFRYTADSGSPTVDLASIGAAQGGPYGITSMTVDADNSFSGVLRLPTAGGPMNFPIGGDIDLDGDDISITFDDATNALEILDPVESGSYTMVNNTLTITLPDVSFDYGLLTGTPSGEVASNLRIVGSRS